MHDSAYQRAFRLLTSPKAKEAFDLGKEPEKLRDRYGRNTFGQSCLMARRLIEGGVRYVTVNHFETVFNLTCWDMHADGGSLNSTYLDYEGTCARSSTWRSPRYTIVVAITSRKRFAATEPTQLLVEVATPAGKQTGLLYDSAVQCENIVTIDNSL